LGVDLSKVVYLGHEFVQTSLRRLDENHRRLIVSEEMRIQAVYSLFMKYTITVNMIDYPTFGTNSEALFSNLTSTLSNSVSGNFYSTLISYANAVSVDLFNTATIVLVNAYQFEVVFPPSAVPTFSPISRNPIIYSSGELAAIVLSVLVGSAILMYLIFSYLGALRDRKQIYTESGEIGAQEESLEEALTSVVPAQQAGGKDEDQIVIVNNENFELAF